MIVALLCAKKKENKLLPNMLRFQTQVPHHHHVFYCFYYFLAFIMSDKVLSLHVIFFRHRAARVYQAGFVCVCGHPRPPDVLPHCV